MRNTRIITAIIAFVGAFALSVGLVGLLFGFPSKPTFNRSYHNCSERHGEAIYSLLRRDISNGQERDEATGYSIEDHANSVAQYADESGSMDVSDLPQDFQIAWHKHMNAWHNYSDFLNDLKESSADQTVDKTDVMTLDNHYTDEINRTWFEVLRIGRSYGAVIR
ncbi:hypothetical protein BH10ACI1_BH10ACI1_09910 [soil metagenome]